MRFLICILFLSSLLTACNTTNNYKQEEIYVVRKAFRDLYNTPEKTIIKKDKIIGYINNFVPKNQEKELHIISSKYQGVTQIDIHPSDKPQILVLLYEKEHKWWFRNKINNPDVEVYFCSSGFERNDCKENYVNEWENKNSLSLKGKSHQDLIYNIRKMTGLIETSYQGTFYKEVEDNFVVPLKK